MAEKEEKGKPEEKAFNPDDRFRYLGFEIKPGKIGDLFKSEAEKESWIQKVIDKRKRKVRIREHNTLEEPRVAGYERIVLTITSAVLVVSLFLPWFSGYHERVVDSEVAGQQNEPAAVVSDSLTEGVMADSLSRALTESETIPGEETTEPTEIAGAVAPATAAARENGATVLEKDEAGFASITSHRRQKEVVRERLSLSAIGAIGSLGAVGGMVFSSGLVVTLTGILMIIYVLCCIGLAVYTLYMLYGIKGDEDTKALKLKLVLRLSWIPVAIYVFCIIIAFFGATYSFDTTDMIKQIGGSYGISTYLGLLSSGFYLTIACFIINGAKSIEI
ncbi:MAG: hypothetical protein JSV44_12285 [Candidatus Zixiibacteriota bacterium]|nr:MAG: hypothetical protein JSV44_12285 [candidate division Zixibacteria bacterium]